MDLKYIERSNMYRIYLVKGKIWVAILELTKEPPIQIHYFDDDYYAPKMSVEEMKDWDENIVKEESVRYNLVEYFFNNDPYWKDLL